MKKLIFLLSLLIAFVCSSQDLTTFVLVRHAEKGSDGTNNPPLTEEGKIRSENLAKMFSRQEVAALYSTPYARTRQTLAPLAGIKSLKVNQYDPSSGKEWLESLATKHSGQTVMISGHSNTIPGLANALLGEETLTQFDEKDYTNLIIIVANKVGSGKLIRLKF